MLKQTKNKVSRKNKTKTKKTSIEEGIPEPVDIKDFHLTDSVESLKSRNEVCNLAREIDQIDFEDKDTVKDDIKSVEQIENEEKDCANVKKEEFASDNLILIEATEFKNPEINDSSLCKNDVKNCESCFNVETSEIINSCGASDAQISNYYNLATKVKIYLEEQYEPSAPAAETHADSPDLAYIPNNIQCLNKDTCESTENFENIQNFNFKLILKDILTPFSDDELSKFYSNSMLDESKTYVSQFVIKEKKNEFEGNKLYELLVKYMMLRNDLKDNKLEIEKLNHKLNVCTSMVWTLCKDIKISEKAKCNDGNIVDLNQYYTHAQFNEDSFSDFDSILTSIRHTTFNVLKLNLFRCFVVKLKIEYYLHCLLSSCPEFSNIHEKSPVVLSSPSINCHFEECLTNLKLAISVLFIFQRKQPAEPDRDFIKETRQWLSDLVSVLLRVANWKDHIFLLNHIVRCPAGINEWATQFIQLPISTKILDPFNCPELNHVMAIMNIILNPIEQCDNFAQKQESNLGNDVNPWTIIDSDGEIEDDSEQPCHLKENDLVSLLNQIPLSYLFRVLFKCDNGEFEGDIVTSDFMLQLFSFLTDFVKILSCGLREYSTERYRQFSKRLGRLIYHIVQYATDLLKLFKSKKMTENEILRVQVEYDNFFLKSSKVIYSAKKNGTWQFLATFPYDMISSTTTLKLYGILQLQEDQNDYVVNVNFINFEKKFLQLSEEEQFYLLTAFANIALGRDKAEIQFIKNVVYQLFYIGFLSEQAKDHCYKNVISLLCSICLCHPHLISEILIIQKNMFLCDPSHNQELSIYLWMKLPVDTWQPTKSDLETLSDWLLGSTNSVQNELSRIILKSLNYGLNEGGLFMPLQSHYAVAMMVLQSNVKFVVDNDAGVIRNVSNLVWSQSSEQGINEWTWNILFKLRLHLLDQPEADISKNFFNLADFLGDVPDIESSAELHQLVLRKQPAATFVALMTTTLGHSIPLILEKGFELIEVLLNADRFEAGIVCLEYLTLCFLKGNECLYKCQKFISVLSRLITADNSYVQYAKNLISNNFPGPVLKCLEVMMQNQINRCKKVAKLGDIISLWLLSLTQIPQWTMESGVLYLIDKILQNSFFNEMSQQLVGAILEDLQEKIAPSSEAKHTFSSIVNWMNSKYTPPSLLSKGVNGDVPWFSYQVIQMEHDIYEKKNLIWSELLKELHLSREKKTNIDNSLKKVCTSLRVPVRPSSVLAIYKWCYLILETDFSHPLLPLIWQKFFLLYFCRVHIPKDCGSVGEKFFDGVINQALFNRLKHRLVETCDYFTKICHNSDKGMKQDHCLKVSALFQTYSLWLHDKRLHEPFINVQHLSVYYNPDLLELLIHGNESFWIEFVEYEIIEQGFRHSSLAWAKMKNRRLSEKEPKTLKKKNEKPILQRISERLNSYEVPLPPPQIELNKYVFHVLNFDTLLHSDKLIFSVKPYLNTLMRYINQYLVMLNENISIGCDMQECLRHLYSTKKTEKVLEGHCKGFNKISNGKNVNYACSGPAFVKLIYEESIINDQVKQNFSSYKKTFDQNVQNALCFPSNIYTSAVLIEIVIEELKKEYYLANNRKETLESAVNLRKTGVSLFYEIIRTFYDGVNQTHFLKYAFDKYIDELGKTFLKKNEDEIDRLLHMILNDDVWGEKLCNFFSPNILSVVDFTKNYSATLKSDSKRRYRTLSKFDLNLWLHQKPRFSERSDLLFIIGWGLKSVNNESDTEQNIVELLNRDLAAILMYEFPEHFGEVLNFLLEASKNRAISNSTWFSFLNVLAFRNLNLEEEPIFFRPGVDPARMLKNYFSKYATHQNLLPFEVIKRTMTILASYFKNERLKAGSCGLYTKYSPYIEPILNFLGILSYSFVAKATEINTGILSDTIAHQLWPLMIDLYSPWLIPYWMENNKGQDSNWTREPNFDGCVLLPWNNNNSFSASFCVSIFTDSIQLLFDALPPANHVLSYVWYFYVTHFAHVYVKDYILNIIHNSFRVLPWESFFPRLEDVEFMLRIADQFLPLCHSFLVSIFLDIKWTNLVQYYVELYDNETTTKLHICLLHLLVKLPLEAVINQNKIFITFLPEAEHYAWHLIDPESYEKVLNYFIMSCDPRIILRDRELENYARDSRILRLLQACAGYVPSAKLFHNTTSKKRILFVRACIKWLITSNRKFKLKNSPLFKASLCALWNDIDTIVTETVPEPQRVAEAANLLREFFEIFKETELFSLVHSTFSDWLLNRKSQVITFGIISSAGASIDTPIIFGGIIETTLENYFEHTENCKWSDITKVLVSLPKSNVRLEKVLIDNNYMLTLYAISLKSLQENDIDFSVQLILTEFLQFLSQTKPSASIEPKLVLLITFCLKLVENEVNHNVTEGILYISQIFDVLNNFVGDKNNGLLLTLGLKKTFSNRFKLVCLIACCGITIFLKNSYPEHLHKVDENILAALDSADSNKSYQSVQQYVLLAKSTIKNLKTMEQIITFLKCISLQLFNKLFLK